MEDFEDEHNLVLDKLFSPGFQPVECKSKHHNIRDYIGIPFGGRKDDRNRNNDDDIAANCKQVQIRLTELNKKEEQWKVANFAMFSVVILDKSESGNGRSEVDLNANILRKTDAIYSSAEDTVNVKLEVDELIEFVPTEEEVLLPEIVKVESLSELSFELMDGQKLEISELSISALSSDIHEEKENDLTDPAHKLLTCKVEVNNTTEYKDLSDTVSSVETSEESDTEKSMSAKKPHVDIKTTEPDHINTSNSEIEVYIDVDSVQDQYQNGTEQKNKLFSSESAYGTAYSYQQCTEDVIEKEDISVKDRFNSDETNNLSSDNIENNCEANSAEKEKKKTYKGKKNLKTNAKNALMQQFDDKVDGRNKFFVENTKAHATILKPNYDCKNDIRKCERKKYNVENKETSESKGKKRCSSVVENSVEENSSEKNKNNITGIADGATNERIQDGGNRQSTKRNSRLKRSKENEDEKLNYKNSDHRESSTTCNVLNKASSELVNKETKGRNYCKTSTLTSIKNMSTNASESDKPDAKPVNESECTINMTQVSDKDKGMSLQRVKNSKNGSAVPRIDKEHKTKYMNGGNEEKVDKEDQYYKYNAFSAEKIETSNKNIKDCNDTQCTKIKNKGTVTECGETKDISKKHSAYPKGNKRQDNKSPKECLTDSVQQIKDIESTSSESLQKKSKGSYENKCTKTEKSPSETNKEKTIEEDHKRQSKGSVLENDQSLNEFENSSLDVKKQSFLTAACDERILNKCKQNTCKRIKQMSEEDNTKLISKDKNDAKINTEDTEHITRSDTMKIDTENKSSEKVGNKIKNKKRRISDTFLKEKPSNRRVLEWLESQITEGTNDKESVEDINKPSLSQMKYKIPKVKDKQNSDDLHNCSDCKNVSFNSKDLLLSHISREHKNKTVTKIRSETLLKKRHVSCPDLEKGKELHNDRRCYSKSDKRSKREHDSRKGLRHVRKQAPSNAKNRKHYKHYNMLRVKKPEPSSSALIEHHEQPIKTKSRSSSISKDNSAVGNHRTLPVSYSKAEEVILNVHESIHEKGMQKAEVRTSDFDSKTNCSSTRTMFDLECDDKRSNVLTKCQNNFINIASNENKSGKLDEGDPDKDLKNSNTNTTDVFSKAIPKYELLTDDTHIESDLIEPNSNGETETIKRKNLDTNGTGKKRYKTDFKQKEEKILSKEKTIEPVENAWTANEGNSETKAKIDVNQTEGIHLKSNLKCSLSVGRWFKCEICEKAYFSDKRKLLQHQHHKHNERNGRCSNRKSSGSKTAITKHVSTKFTHHKNNRFHHQTRSVSFSEEDAQKNDINLSLNNEKRQSSNFLEENENSATTKRCTICNMVFFIGSIERHMRIVHPGDCKTFIAEDSHEKKCFNTNAISKESNSTGYSKDKFDTGNTQEKLKNGFGTTAVKDDAINAHAHTKKTEKLDGWDNSAINRNKPQEQQFFQRNNFHQNFRETCPWQCRKCKQRFAKKHLLKRHIRTAGHFKPFK